MNIYLIILIIIAIVVFANLAMFASVRSSRGMKFNWLNTTKSGLSHPFKREDDQLSELRRRVEDLAKADEEENRESKVD